MEKIILVAHGCLQNGIWSDNGIMTITQGGANLTVAEVKSYLGGLPFPEYGETSLGSFVPMNDKECLALFGKIPVGTGIAYTGIKRGATTRERIFVLRGVTCTFDDLALFARSNGTRIVIAACRAVVPVARN